MWIDGVIVLNSFKINFVYPWLYKKNKALQINALKKYPGGVVRVEAFTFSEISLYFNGSLYRPSWSNQNVNFTDTEYLLHFFERLVTKINSVQDKKTFKVVFVDDPLSLNFKKNGNYVDIWVSEAEKMVETRITWARFVYYSKKSANKFLKILLRINKRLSAEPQVKSLIKQLQV